MGGTTRERILIAAQEMLQTRSFNGFGFEDLAKRVGIRKPSLYHHFKSKGELGAEIMARMHKRLEDFAERENHTSGADELAGYLRFMGDEVHAGERLCPGCASIASWGVLPEPLKEQVKRLGPLHVSWLTRIVERGRGDGTLDIRHHDVNAVARWIHASVLGALVVARVAADRHIYELVVEQVSCALTSRDGSPLIL